MTPTSAPLLLGILFEAVAFGALILCGIAAAVYLASVRRARSDSKSYDCPQARQTDG